MTAVQRQVTVTSNTPEGTYFRLVLDAPDIAQTAAPGQFVAIAVGGVQSAMLLRRCFSLSMADPAKGTIEIMIAVRGPGSEWLSRRKAGQRLDLTGPLGHPFPAPAGRGTSASHCVLVGGGYGAAPMVWWARDLRWRGYAVSVVLGAGDAGRLAGVEQAQALGVPVYVTTDDGSAGIVGKVTDALQTAIADPVGASAPQVEVYACGPMPMLRAVTVVGTTIGSAGERPVKVWCAVEESMACGIGVCMTCVIPVAGEQGLTRMARTCVEGPVFDGTVIRWEELR